MPEIADAIERIIDAFNPSRNKTNKLKTGGTWIGAGRPTSGPRSRSNECCKMAGRTQRT
jgi:hypothetical protein